MNKDWLVQVVVSIGDGNARCGTAYPIAPGRLITAAHVIGDGEPERIEVSWYHQSGEDRKWKPCTRIIWDGRPAFDVVVLEAQCPDSVKNACGALCSWKPKTGFKWESEGFPRVGNELTNWTAIPMKGETYSTGAHSELFQLSVDDPPSQARGWKGASGSPVFVNGRIVGINIKCPDNFANGRLEAVPTWRLLRNAKFREAAGVKEDERALRSLVRDIWFCMRRFGLIGILWFMLLVFTSLAVMAPRLAGLISSPHIGISTTDVRTYEDHTRRHARTELEELSMGHVPPEVASGTLQVHVQKVQLCDQPLAKDLNSNVKRTGESVWIPCDKEVHYLGRGDFEPPLPLDNTIIGRVIAPSDLNEHNEFPCVCKLSANDAPFVIPSPGTKAFKTATVKVTIVSWASPWTPWLYIGFGAAAAVFGFFICRAVLRIWEITFFERAIFLAFWVFSAFGVFAALVALKYAQRLLEGKSGWDAFADAWLTRARNHSSWVIGSHLGAIIVFSMTALFIPVARFRVKAWHLSVVAVLAAILGGLYIVSIRVGPDPGTFVTYKDPTLFWMQCIEGYMNLFVLSAAAFWLVIGATMAWFQQRVLIGIGSVLGSLVPIFTFVIAACITPKTLHWDWGNLKGAIYGLSAVLAFLYLLFFFVVTARRIVMLAKALDSRSLLTED